jgi:alkaline phosphatase
MNAVRKSTSLKLAGLIASVNNPFRLNGRGDMLPASSRKAIEILNKNPKGFFLLIEGGQIDPAAHAKDAIKLIDETLDFDEAVGEVLNFAQNDGHTLVVITADHETGGAAITGGSINAHRVILNFPTIGHTAVMVPVFAYGPGAEKFGGIYDNTAFFQKFISSYGFEELKQQ